MQEELNLSPQPEFNDFRAYNLGPGQQAPVLMADGQFHWMRFGLTPFWAKKPMLLFNARSEGDQNKENDPEFKGAAGIIQKPAFRMPIRKQRCLVFANGFLEGPEKEKLSKPYYIFDQNRDFMGLAAIYDRWTDTRTGEEITGFSILTTGSNPVTQAIGHHRSPVILQADAYSTWLHAERLDEVTELLHPDRESRLNAYPISPDIKHPAADNEDLLKPIGPAVLKETSVRFKTEFDTLGFGRKKKL